MMHDLQVREEAHMTPAMDALFRLRYGTPGPDFPHHVVAWWNDGGTERALCYINFCAQGEALLGGGACVDPRQLRRVPKDLREAIRTEGGLYHLSLAWSLRHFATRYRAVFGYCGDPLAARVDRAVGFTDTGYPHLLVYWLADCDDPTRARLIAAAHAVGPF